MMSLLWFAIWKFHRFQHQRLLRNNLKTFLKARETFSCHEDDQKLFQDAGVPAAVDPALQPCVLGAGVQVGCRPPPTHTHLTRLRHHHASGIEIETEYKSY